AGLRFHTGWDWEAYDYFFYELTNSNLFEISKANIFNYEPGFVLLSYISVLLHIPPFLFFSLITVTLIIKSAYKYLGNFVYIFLLIYLYYGYFHNFSIVRQGVAAALFAYSIRYLIAKSYKYYILIFVAALFHMSAIMLLIVPFLYKIANRIPFSALLLFSLLMVYTSVSELIGMKSLLSG
ncbi:EpsG family protein, partial [Escherichia coli]|nr:EpsG family protein [Escherichia coli]